MKGIALRILITLLISIVGTFLLHRLLLLNVRKYFVAFSKNEQIFLKDTPAYDVLLLGSSRMLSTVDPRILDSVTGSNSFNLGQNAATIAEVSANLRGYLAARRAPRMVVIALDLHMLNCKKNFALYPYYLTSIENPVIGQLLKQDGFKLNLYRWFPFLTVTEYGDYFKSTLLKNALGRTDIPPGDHYYKGYVSNSTDTIRQAPVSDTSRQAIDALPVTDFARAAFAELLKTCHENRIKLVCIYAPEYQASNYRRIKNTAQIMAYYRSELARYGVPLLEHQLLPFNNDRRLFANIGHVNRIGAEYYSGILADTLKKLLPK